MKDLLFFNNKLLLNFLVKAINITNYLQNRFFIKNQRKKHILKEICIKQ